MPIAPLSALPPQISSNAVAFSLEPRPGTPAYERVVAHRHADAENARRDFGPLSESSSGIRHAGSAYPERSG
jgi:hypothetical protein